MLARLLFGLWCGAGYEILPLAMPSFFDTHPGFDTERRLRNTRMQKFTQEETASTPDRGSSGDSRSAYNVTVGECTRCGGLGDDVLLGICGNCVPEA